MGRGSSQGKEKKKKTSTCTREVLRMEDKRCTVGLSIWNVIYHFGTEGIAEFFKKGMTWLFFKLAYWKDNFDINVEKNEVAGRQLEDIKCLIQRESRGLDSY